MGRLKLGKFLNLISYISGIKQDCFQYHCFGIQGAGVFQTPGVFIDSPGRIAIWDSFIVERMAASTESLIAFYLIFNAR